MLSIALFQFIPAIAAPHGRLYSLDDGTSSSLSPAFSVFIFIVGVILGIMLIVIVLKDNKHSGSDKGCLVTIFLGIIAIAFFALMHMLNK